MRTEKEMFDLIINTAKNDNRVLAVIMNGSRTNPNIPKDIFQDYDIVYVVKETKSFIENRDWINIFGNPIIFQFPDELDKIVGDKTQFKYNYGYLMQFDDGNRIDLHIQTLDLAINELKSDKLSIILLDKDNILPKIQPPSDRDYWIKKPTKDLFYRCCNEYWWVLLYIGKGNWRNEILFSLEHLNLYVRPQLFQMICWYVGIRTNFSCSIGKSGKYLNKYLDNDIWERYLKTYPTADINSIWNSVFIMSELFEQLAIYVSEEFNFIYDSKESKRCLDYMHHIKNLSKDAKQIINQPPKY